MASLFLAPVEGLGIPFGPPNRARQNFVGAYDPLFLSPPESLGGLLDLLLGG